MVKAEDLYTASPVVIQNVLCSLEGWRINRRRYSRGFWNSLYVGEERNRFNYEDVIAFRDKRLAKFVRHAVETTAHYRDLFSSLGLRHEDVTSLDDMRALPILRKAEIQDAPERFVSAAVKKSELVRVHTSGTTGGGLRFFTTLDAQQEQWAVWWRYWRRHGLKPGVWSANFGGRSIVPVGQRNEPYWRINLAGRQILFSAYHATPENMTDYLKALRKWRPPWFHGYPSQLALIAYHVLETDFDLGYQPKWITIGAENLLPHQVAAIEAAFGCKPIQHYGMAEAAANFSQCELGRLHVDEDFAAVEFIDINEGGTCRIVGTNMSNHAFPLLRYDVGDQAQLSDDRCGCSLPGRTVSSIDGRQEDYIITPDGAKVGRLDHIFKDLTRIREAQILQVVPGEIVVKIVRSSLFGQEDESMLRKELAMRLGGSMKISFEYVAGLERTGTGKLRFVVNKINAGSILPEKT